MLDYRVGDIVIQPCFLGHDGDSELVIGHGKHQGNVTVGIENK